MSSRKLTGEPIVVDSKQEVIFWGRPETRMNTKPSSGDGIGDGI